MSLHNNRELFFFLYEWNFFSQVNADWLVTIGTLPFLYEGSFFSQVNSDWLVTIGTLPFLYEGHFLSQVNSDWILHQPVFFILQWGDLP